ncbi:MAG: preprotein translocase subunit SecG [Proteobacteria bacterium]|nr:preprotein translocase subunit SecG [Pseudomonadota bacterium]
MYISMLTVAHIILAVLLILIVLLQRSESSMGALGGANAVFSGKSVSTILTKATTIIAILFMAVSLLIVRINYQSNGAKSVVEKMQVEQTLEVEQNIPAEKEVPSKPVTK